MKLGNTEANAVRYIYVCFLHAAVVVCVTAIICRYKMHAHVAHTHRLSGTHLEKVPLYGIHARP